MLFGQHQSMNCTYSNLISVFSILFNIIKTWKWYNKPGTPQWWLPVFNCIAPNHRLISAMLRLLLLTDDTCAPKCTLLHSWESAIQTFVCCCHCHHNGNSTDDLHLQIQDILLFLSFSFRWLWTERLVHNSRQSTLRPSYYGVAQCICPDVCFSDYVWMVRYSALWAGQVCLV